MSSKNRNRGQVVTKGIVTEPVVVERKAEDVERCVDSLLSSLRSAHLTAKSEGFATQAKQLEKMIATVMRKQKAVEKKRVRDLKAAERQANKAERAMMRLEKKKSHTDKSVARLKALTEKVKAAGYSEADVAKMLGIKVG